MNKTDRSSDTHEAESTYSRATKAEHSRDYDLAYRLYVKSAELYLHLVRGWPENGVAGLRASAEKAIHRAERVKAFVENSDSKSGLSNAKNITPVGINHFSIQEQSYILWKGASVNGHVFPSWDEPIHSGPSRGLYSDPDGQPLLSAQQAKVSPIWRRPPPPSTIAPQRILPEEILQVIVADCSVCASISVCLEHARRFGSKLAQSHIEPDSSVPGRYDIKVFFNGTWRRIVVDDALPYNPVSDTWMCMSVRIPDNESPPIWPSILEKGYMKLMGGYDFPGSNSSIDLNVITGWIPEHLELKGPTFEREKYWRRIFRGFQNGHCMVTIGTGTGTNTFWQGFTFLPSHNYAVIDMKEEDDMRILTVLDTWVITGFEDSLQARGHRIPWHDSLHIFDGIYLNWDPSIWPTALVHQGRWQRRQADERTSTRQVHLQFNRSKMDSEQEIWVLLARHVIDSKQQADFISLKVDMDDDLSSVPSAVDLATIAAKGNYTNSTHILVRTKLPPSHTSGILSIFTSYDGDSPEAGFTLTVYAGADIAIAWDEKVQTPSYTKRVDGILTSRNAGGNCTYPTFMLNPEYHLQFHQSQDLGPSQTKLTLTLQTSRDIPVNILLACSQGERIYELAAKDVIATSGPYTYGLARLSFSKALPARDYTVIVSAFETQQLGEFSLTVESSERLNIKAIPYEGAGMYTKVIRGKWSLTTAAGGPTSVRYSKNPIFEIDVPSLAQTKVRLQLLHPSSPTCLNLTIFPAASDGFLRRHVTTSGAYSDAICGVVTPQVVLTPGKYWAVPSTYNPGVEAGFQLYLYTNIQGVRIVERASA